MLPIMASKANSTSLVFSMDIKNWQSLGALGALVDDSFRPVQTAIIASIHQVS
jgi:hypothetical protein